MPRLFLAIPIPEEVRDVLAAAQSELQHDFRRSKVSWVTPGNFHITLHFLGDITEETLASLTEALSAANYPRAFPLHLSHISAFPNPKNPKVLYADTNIHSHLLELRRRTANVLLDQGFDIDLKQFTPHITLGRVTTRSEVLRHERAALEQLAFGVDRFQLIESTLTPNGSIYRILREFSLPV